MLIGVLLAVLAGICLGTCFLPMRYLKGFAWENTWFVWAFTGLVVLPPLIALATIPNLFGVYQTIGWKTVLAVLGVGLVAGTSGIFLGRGLAMAGVTLANSLNNGVALVVGSFVPLMMANPQALKSNIGLMMIGGIVAAVVGVVILAIAGSQRAAQNAVNETREDTAVDGIVGNSKTEEALTASHPNRSARRLAWLGIAFCLIAGLLTPLQNIGLAASSKMIDTAQAAGAPEAFKSFAYFVPYFLTSFVSNGIYFLILWRKNGTLREFTAPNGLKYTLIAVGMAVVWMIGIALYGWAVPVLGVFGPVIIYPIVQVSQAMSAALSEYFLGEWKGRALKTLALGLAALMLSIVAFSYTSYINQQQPTSVQSVKLKDAPVIASTQP